MCKAIETFLDLEENYEREKRKDMERCARKVIFSYTSFANGELAEVGQLPVHGAGSSMTLIAHYRSIKKLLLLWTVI
jgi:hypothetical protein